MTVNCKLHSIFVFSFRKDFHLIICLGVVVVLIVVIVVVVVAVVVVIVVVVVVVIVVVVIVVMLISIQMAGWEFFPGRST